MKHTYYLFLLIFVISLTASARLYAEDAASVEDGLLAGDWATVAGGIQALPPSEQMQMMHALNDRFDALSHVAAAPPAARELVGLDEAELAAAADAEALMATADDAATIAQLPQRERLLTAPVAADNRSSRAILTVGDSCTYSTPFAALQAANSGDTIHMQGKTFTSWSAAIDINDKSLTIVGGYNATCSALTTSPTTIDVSGVTDTAVEIAGTSGHTIVLENLVLTGSSADPDDGGGLQMMANHSVTLRNVEISGNSATNGAGVHITAGTLNIEAGSRIHSNEATNHGGGVYCVDGQVTISGNSTIGNRVLVGLLHLLQPNKADSDDSNSGFGGGLYLSDCSLTFDGDNGDLALVQYNEGYIGGGIYATDNSLVLMVGAGAGVVGNSAESSGGGVYLSDGADLTAVDGAITHNSSGNFGGGVYVRNSSSRVYVSANTGTPCSAERCMQLSNNRATTGGGVYAAAGADVVLIQTWVAENEATGFGSAIYARESGTTVDVTSSMLIDSADSGNYVVRLFSGGEARSAHAKIINSTIAGNSPASHIFGIDDKTALSIFGSIVHGNSGQLKANSGELLVDCSILQEAWGGSQNRVAEPLFRDAENSDYHLLRNSPAIDFCNGSGARDIDGDLRPQSGNRSLNSWIRRIESEGARQAARTAEDMTTAVRLPTTQLEDVDLDAVLGSAVRAENYGSYVWLEVTDAQRAQLESADVAIQPVPDHGQLVFGDVAFDPLRDDIGRAAALAPVDQDNLYLVQLHAPATDLTLAQLSTWGTVLQYIPDSAYLVWANGVDAARALAEAASRRDSDSDIRWIGAYQPMWRQSGRAAAQPAAERHLLWVVNDGSLDALAAEVAQAGGSVLDRSPRRALSEDLPTETWEVELSAEALAAVRAQPQLIWLDVLDELQLEDEVSNQVIAGNTAINIVGGNAITVPTVGYAGWLTGLGVDGSGVTVAVVDSGVDWDHPDLNVVSGTEYDSVTYSEAGKPGSDHAGHGTHVAGIIAGTGASGNVDAQGFLYGQGVAPGAVIHAMDATARRTMLTYDFELTNGGFTGTGEWEWGAPAGAPGTMPSGFGAWGTDMDGTYSHNHIAILTSSAIDMTSVDNPSSHSIRFDRWYDLASGDCLVVHVSKDNGSTWVATDYSVCGFADGWNTTFATVPDGFNVSQFRFRFVFTSDGSGNSLGAYIDNVAIRASQKLYQRFYDAAANSDLSNNSYRIGSGTGHGYSFNASNVDSYVLDAVDDNGSTRDLFLAVFSAGNAGDDCTTGPCIDSLTDPKSAKNILVVGNTKTNRNCTNSTGVCLNNEIVDDISASSSRGPTYMPRESNVILPHVMAPGNDIVSTQSADNPSNSNPSCNAQPINTTIHQLCSGTSMAAPHVSGAAALFTQQYRIRNRTDNNPAPALVKAAIIATTDDIAGADDGYGNPIGNRPNHHQGWGRINISRLLSPTVNTLYYENPMVFTSLGQFWDTQVRAAEPSEPMRVTLVYSDPAAMPGSDPRVVNDLDLELFDSDGVRYPGNYFGNDGWSEPDGAFHDRHNTVENSWIASPNSGVYTIRVSPNLLGGDGYLYTADLTDQHFSLVCYNCEQVLDGTHDAGADEAASFVGINGLGCHYGSIGEAVNAASSGHTIYVTAGDYNETLGTVDKDLTIVAATGACTSTAAHTSEEPIVTINGGNSFSSSGGIINVGENRTVTLRGIVLEQAQATFGGLAYVQQNAHLILDNVLGRLAQATQYGGAIRVYNGQLTLQNETRIGLNQATGPTPGVGGGIAARNSDVAISNSTVSFNLSTTDGGGIYLDGGTLQMTNTTLEQNIANEDGGGLYALNGADVTILADATCDATTLAANTYCSMVRDNQAADDGGGLYVSNSTTTVSQTQFAGNDVGVSSANHGGAILVSGGTLTMLNTLIENNSNTAVYAGDSASLVSTHSTFTNNNGVRPLNVTASADATLKNNIIWGNTNSVGIISNLTSECNINQGSPFGGINDSSIDPQFITTGRGDYRIGNGSPAVNVCATGLSVDLDGNARPTSPSYDMGAFEAPATSTAVTLNASSAEGGITLVWLRLFGGLLLLTVGVVALGRNARAHST